MPRLKNQHVVPHKGGCAVKGEGASKATKVTSTQKLAIERTRKIAKNEKSEVVIHGKDGKIRNKDSYGNDPASPKN